MNRKSAAVGAAMLSALTLAGCAARTPEEYNAGRGALIGGTTGALIGGLATGRAGGALAMALADKGGVGKAKLLEVLIGTLFGAPIYRNYGAMIRDEAYRPAGFAAPLGLKDMKLVSAAAEALRVPMPVLGILREQLIATIAQQGDEIDWSGVAGTIARSAGL